MNLSKPSTYLHVTSGNNDHKFYRNGRRISKAEFRRIDKNQCAYSYDRKNGCHYFRWTESREIR